MSLQEIKNEEGDIIDKATEQLARLFVMMLDEVEINKNNNDVN